MKDFDFDPEYSTADLVGGIVLRRELADSRLWKKKPFDPAHALVDLHLLANTSAGEFKSQGGAAVAYKPGWLIWSNRGLADRWGWRQESVQTFLRDLEALEVIRRHDIGQRWKAVEMVHHCSTDGALPEHQPGTNGDGGELGVRSKEKGEGDPQRLYPLELAFKHFGMGSGYTTDQVREQWLYYDALRDPKTGDWQKPRGNTGVMVRISDPRSELAQALLRFAKKTPNATTPSASVTLIALEKELRELEDEIQQARDTNQPRDAKKMARVRELRAQVERLKS